MDEGGEPSRPGVCSRGELEFDRLAFFSDAIYAISLTLLVVGLQPPRLSDPDSSSELWSALGDVQSQIWMFFISFLVIGSFWLAHHRFIARLVAVDRTLMAVSLIYLAFIAFLPFPSALLGDDTGNSVAVGLYALCLAVVASLEAVLFAIARRHHLLGREPSERTYRWGMLLSLTPAALFLVSIPIAFASPTVGILFWLLAAPLGAFLGRRAPGEVAAYYDA